MTDSDVKDALIILRAAVIAMVARKRGVRVSRPELERMLRDGVDNTEALERMVSRKEADSSKRNFFARLLGAFGLRRSA
jgi:hypothetical protein